MIGCWGSCVHVMHVQVVLPGLFMSFALCSTFLSIYLVTSVVLSYLSCNLLNYCFNLVLMFDLFLLIVLYGILLSRHVVLQIVLLLCSK